MNFSSYIICQAIIGNRHNTRNLTIMVIVVVMAAGKAIMRMQIGCSFCYSISESHFVDVLRRRIYWGKVSIELNSARSPKVTEKYVFPISHLSDGGN